MSLEGNLTAFGLSEILQLIAVQQKTGMLSVSNQDRSSVLFFRQGNIISTRDRRRKTKDPLRDYLTRYGILTREDLIRITQLGAQAKLDITDIIVSEKLLSEEQMKHHYRSHIQEEVHEILTWEQCSYKFIPGRDIIEGITNLGEFNIEGLLMESMRRIDEFPQMLKAFPSLGTRIDKAGKPGKDVELSSNEKTIRSLLSQERTLSDLIANGKMPRFEAYEALKHLKDKNLITVTLEEKEEVDGKRRPRNRKKVRRTRANALPVIVAILLFLFFAAWGGRLGAPDLSAIPTLGVTPGAEASIARNRAEEQLRIRLEAYRALYSTYPSSVRTLKSSGLATAAFLDEMKRHSFRYHLTAEGARYTLL
ncbi:MAG: DUF4388 domain-containing protein [Candidatus Krumholzibacteriia bacterium]